MSGRFSFLSHQCIQVRISRKLTSTDTIPHDTEAADEFGAGCLKGADLSLNLIHYPSSTYVDPVIGIDPFVASSHQNPGSWLIVGPALCMPMLEHPLMRPLQLLASHPEMTDVT